MQSVAVPAPRDPGLLTKELLQLHDAGVGSDAVNGLRLPCIRLLLENLAVRSVRIMLVRHVVEKLFVELRLLIESC